MCQLAAEQLNRHGVKLVVITPTENSSEVLIDPDCGLDHTVLEDPERSVAQLLLGEGNGGGSELPLPATFLVDATGKIQHSSTSDSSEDSVDEDRVAKMLTHLPRQ